MDFSTVQKQLTDLPLTFQRPGTPFTQWIDALTAGLTRDTAALDQLLSQVQSVDNAVYGWADIWGLLAGIPRFSNEEDRTYITRIIYILNAGGGTPVGMAAWIGAVWKVSAQITETFGQVGYNIVFNTTITLEQAVAIVASMVRIRPAGVPILSISVASRTTLGMFLDTINFLDLAPSVTGAYLSGTGGAGGGVAVPGLYPATNSAVPLLPDLLLTDPTLNPSLAPTG